MARKYDYYVLATDLGTETYYNYREALGDFMRSESATLYGYSEDVESIIRSK